jgi:hypothetical protein
MRLRSLLGGHGREGHQVGDPIVGDEGGAGRPPGKAVLCPESHGPRHFDGTMQEPAETVLGSA